MVNNQNIIYIGKTLWLKKLSPIHYTYNIYIKDVVFKLNMVVLLKHNKRLYK